MQQEIVANRSERKERFAAFLRLQYQRSMQMLQANVSGLHDPEENRAALEQIKEDRNLQDLSLFLYRLDSDFEDKRRKLDKMLFKLPVRVSRWTILTHPYPHKASP